MSEFNEYARFTLTNMKAPEEIIDCIIEVYKQILEYMIKTYTNEGMTVLDNCMGSGTTGVACLNTNRKFIGIESNEGYFEISCKRMEEKLKV